MYIAETIWTEKTQEGKNRIKSDCQLFTLYQDALQHLNKAEDGIRKIEGFIFRAGKIYEVEEVKE